MKLDLFDLTLLLRVAEHSSLSKAAEVCCISIPAASARLKHLEENAGAALFTRTSHGLEVTRAGEIMVEHARLIVTQVESMRTDLLDHVGTTSIHVRVYATTLAMVGPLPLEVGLFINDHRRAIIDLTERRSTEVLRAIEEGRADFGLLNETALVRGFEQYSFSSERLVLAVAASHRFAHRQSIRFHECLDEQHINMPADSSVGSALPEIAAAAGGRGRGTGTRVTSFESMCRLVEMGVGVGVVPLSAVQRHGEHMNVRLVPLEDPWAHAVVKLVAREGVRMPTVARQLFDRLRSAGARRFPGT